MTENISPLKRSHSHLNRFLIKKYQRTTLFRYENSAKTRYQAIKQTKHANAFHSHVHPPHKGSFTCVSYATAE